MIKRLSILFLVIVLVACNSIDKPPKPDELISEDKMIDIMYDISLINGIRTSNTGKLKASGVEPDHFVYDKYEIDSIQLAQNIAYYSVEFSQYGRMWEAVRDRIKANLDSVNKLVKTQDSIDRADIVKRRQKVEGINDTASIRIRPAERPRKLNDSIL